MSLSGLAGLLPAQTLPPYVVESNRVRLEFINGPYGVALDSIAENESAPRFLNSPAPTRTNSYLWEIRLESGAPVRPDNNCIKTPVPGGFLFTWLTIALGAGEPTLRVDMLVLAQANDPMARWWISVSRAAGQHSRAIMEVLCPILTLNPPIDGGTSVLDSITRQARARLLIPSNMSFEPAIQTWYPNWNLGAFMTVCDLRSAQASYPVDPPRARATHPGSNSMQFSAIFDGDPSSTRYRRILYLGSEDRDGYGKHFDYGAETVLGPRHLWSHVYVPTFDDVFVVPPEPAPHGRGNTFIAPYPVTTGVLTAATDDWWYDVCSHYRGFVESSGIGGPPIENNPWIGGMAKSPSVVTAAIYAPPSQGLCLGVHRATRMLLANPHFTPKEYLHTHSYSAGSIYPRNPPVYFPQFMSSFVTPARSEGVNVSIYINGPSINEGFGWPALPSSARLYDILGQPVVDNNGNAALDYGRIAGQTWMADNVLATVLNDAINAGTSINGAYIDLFSSSAPVLAYDDTSVDPVNPQEHPAHGGKHQMAGKRALLAHTRLKVRGPQQNYPDAALLSETVQEYLQDLLDFTPHGNDWTPNHLMLGEDAVLARLAAQFPPQSQWYTWIQSLRPVANGAAQLTRNLTPPLWSAVYHAHSHAQNLRLMITSTPLRGGPEYQAPQGLLPMEWENLHCYGRASWVTSGARAAFLNYAGVPPFDYPPVFYHMGLLVYDQVNDPSQTGPHIYSFIATLHAAEQRTFGGQFTMFGTMQRPLVVNYSSAAVHTAVNPSEACVRGLLKTDFNGGGLLFLENTEDGGPAWFIRLGACEDFFVPRVVHSVWRSPENLLGIVLVNWSDQTADFQATFDPTLYGISPTQTYTIERISFNGVGVKACTATGTTTIDARATSSLPVNFGALPPRSIMVLKVY